MDKVKAIVYGVGEMGRLAAKMMIEKGVEITGAIGHRSHVGEDLGRVIGLDYDLGVIISNDAEAVLENHKADIAVIAVGSLISQMFPHIENCISHGLNVITITEELFYPWNIFPEHASEIDRLSKEREVTVVSVGIQDIYWLNLFTVISGASHRIDSVLGQATSNVEDYGPLATSTLHVGTTEAEYYELVKNQEIGISFFGMSLECIVSKVGMHMADKKEWVEPIIGDHDIYSKSIRQLLHKGTVIGTKQITEIDTQEGVSFRSEFITTILPEGETGSSSWFLKGVPCHKLISPDLPGPEATCAALVNRIPDVINACPGLLTVDRLPEPRFRNRIEA